MFIVVGFRPPLQFGAHDQDRKFSPAKRWETDKGGHRRTKRRDVNSEEKRSQKRREEKSEEKRSEVKREEKSAEGRLELEMTTPMVRVVSGTRPISSTQQRIWK